ncbi:MAG: response regulator, partial [Steroidobacterales bacterium]
MSGEQRAIRVLVADDDATVRALASATLESAGFVVQTVENGDAAVAACVLALPDLALLDVEMPQGNGYQTCAAIRALPGGLNLPIVMVTGLDDPLSINHAYDAGATDFVVKPINWALLVHRIRYVLRGARTIDDLRLSEQKNAALLKAIPDGIFLVDAAGAIRHCFSPMDGLASASRHLIDMLPPSTHGRALEGLTATLGGAPVAFEFALENAGQAARHFECRYLPNATGQVLA